MSGIHCQSLLNHWKVGWGHHLSLLVLVHSCMNAVPPIWKNTHQFKWNHRQQVLINLKQILKLCFWITRSLSAVIIRHRSLPAIISVSLLQDLQTIPFIIGSRIFKVQVYRCMSAHPIISINILSEFSVSLSFIWLTFQAPHWCVSDDSGFSRERWNSWWLIIRTVQLRERRSGRCFIFLVTGKHRYLANSMKTVWHKLTESSLHYMSYLWLL